MYTCNASISHVGAGCQCGNEVYTCNASISHVRTGCQCGNEVYTCNAGMTDPSESCESCVYVDVGFRSAYQLETSGGQQKFQHSSLEA